MLPSRSKLRAAAAFAFLCVTSLPLAAAELLMFEAPACPYCARWRAEVGPGYAKSAEGRRAPLHELAIEEASGLRIQFNAPIVVSPTFVVVDGGKEIGRIIGYPGPDFFWGFLEPIVAKLGPIPRP
jgi:hypothetical protein